jgi:4-amino-4-deoxy-L-arabinose transferase-like glycosyltransferase
MILLKIIPDDLKNFYKIIFPQKILFSLFLLGLILRLVFVIFYVGNDPTKLPVSDQIIHHNIALNLIHGKGLSLPAILLEAPDSEPQWVKDKFKFWKEIGGIWGVIPLDKPQTSFPPLHPLYLALVYRIFGPNPIASRIIQAFISTISAIILYHVAKRYFDPTTAFIVYLVVIFYPYYIYYTGVLLMETICIFLVSLFFLLFKIMKEKDKVSYPLLCGFIFGLLFLTNPVFQFFFPLTLLTVILTYPKKIRNISFITLAFIITISPWVIRNYGIYHQLIISPTKAGWNLWERNNYRLNPQYLNVEHPELKDLFNIISEKEKEDMKRKDLTYYPDFSGKTEPERDKIFSSMFWGFIKANPIIYIKLCYIRFFEFFRVTHKYLVGNTYKILSWLSIGSMLILGTIGGVFLLKRWRELLAFYLLLAYYIPLHIMFTAEPRYRLPIDFIFIFFGSYILSRLINIIFPQFMTDNFPKNNQKRIA